MALQKKKKKRIQVPTLFLHREVWVASSVFMSTALKGLGKRCETQSPPCPLSVFTSGLTPLRMPCMGFRSKHSWQRMRAGCYHRAGRAWCLKSSRVLPKHIFHFSHTTEGWELCALLMNPRLCLRSREIKKISLDLTHPGTKWGKPRRHSFLFGNDTTTKQFRDCATAATRLSLTCKPT